MGLAAEDAERHRLEVLRKVYGNDFIDFELDLALPDTAMVGHVAPYEVAQSPSRSQEEPQGSSRQSVLPLAEHRVEIERFSTAVSDEASGSPSVNDQTEQSGSAGQKRRRGAPIKIPAARKAEALAIKEAGGTNRDAAKKLYDTRYPTDRQVKDTAKHL
jgi:hypothetical protein